LTQSAVLLRGHIPKRCSVFAERWAGMRASQRESGASIESGVAIEGHALSTQIVLGTSLTVGCPSLGAKPAMRRNRPGAGPVSARRPG